jgi:co-chaperonin GroES (HSP10)
MRDYVVILQDVQQDVTASGIIRSTAHLDPMMTGTVVAAGTDYNGTQAQHIKAGDRVLYPRLEGKPEELVGDDGEPLIVFRAQALVAKLTDDPRVLLPLWNYVVVKRDPRERQEGLLLVPTPALSHTGTVVAVGPGELSEDGSLHLRPIPQVGDRVQFPSFTGEVHILDESNRDDHLVLIRDNQIDAILEA